MKLVIQIPCFNEAETLPITYAALPKHIEGIDDIEVLIIDDGSTDSTVKVAQELGVTQIVKIGQNSGLANAFKTGLTKAIEMDADIIVNTDADNQYCSDDIEKIIRPILENKADIVIGERPIVTIKDFSMLKKFYQKLGSYVMKLLSSSCIEDAPSGFRAFSKDAALQLNIFDNYTYTMETIIQASAKRLRLKSVPIRVNPKTRESKLVKSIFDYIKRSAFTMLRMFIIYRPFRFFITLGILMILLGLIPGARFLYFYIFESGSGHIQSLILSAILILTGVQISLIAVLADLISINRRLIEDIQVRIKKTENKKL